MTKMNTAQKAAKMNEFMDRLAGDFRREDKIWAAKHVEEARILLMSSPDSAARLFDIIREA